MTTGQGEVAIDIYQLRIFVTGPKTKHTAGVSEPSKLCQVSRSVLNLGFSSWPINCTYIFFDYSVMYSNGAECHFSLNERLLTQYSLQS